MYCPGCKRDVVGQKVFDFTTFGYGCLLGIALFIVFSVLGSPIAGLGFVACALVGASIKAWFDAPLACPNCRTRLVNPLVGDEPPAYENKEQAYKSSRQGFCHACKAENVADAVYCSKCGAKLESAPTARPIHNQR